VPGLVLERQPDVPATAELCCAGWELEVSFPCGSASARTHGCGLMRWRYCLGQKLSQTWAVVV